MIQEFLSGEYLYATLIFFAVAVLPYIFYLVMQSSILEIISPENRKMKPGAVWIAIIPLYGHIWHFMVVDAIAVSLREEFYKYGKHTPAKPAYSAGIAACILLAAWPVPVFGSAMAVIGYFVWIYYWIRIADYKKKLIQAKKFYQQTTETVM